MLAGEYFAILTGVTFSHLSLLIMFVFRLRTNGLQYLHTSIPMPILISLYTYNIVCHFAFNTKSVSATWFLKYIAARFVMV